MYSPPLRAPKTIHLHDRLCTKCVESMNRGSLSKKKTSLKKLDLCGAKKTIDFLEKYKFLFLMNVKKRFKRISLLFKKKYPCKREWVGYIGLIRAALLLTEEQVPILTGIGLCLSPHWQSLNVTLFYLKRVSLGQFRFYFSLERSPKNFRSKYH